MTEQRKLRLGNSEWTVRVTGDVEVYNPQTGLPMLEIDRADVPAIRELLEHAGNRPEPEAKKQESCGG